MGGARLLTGASRTPRLVGNHGPGTTIATRAAAQASTTRASCHSGAEKARRRAYPTPSWWQNSQTNTRLSAVRSTPPQKRSTSTPNAAASSTAAEAHPVRSKAHTASGAVAVHSR